MTVHRAVMIEDFWENITVKDFWKSSQHLTKLWTNVQWHSFFWLTV